MVLDRFLIDLELSVFSTTASTTYSGIHNVAQFDLSFRIDCSENYHGPQCNVFCMEVPGQFTCNNDGTKMCVNGNLSPESNCTQCRVLGRDPQNNCDQKGIISSNCNAHAQNSQPACWSMAGVSSSKWGVYLTLTRYRFNNFGSFVSICGIKHAWSML